MRTSGTLRRPMRACSLSRPPTSSTTPGASSRTFGATLEQLWTRFNASRKQTLWYYRRLVDAYRANTLSRQDLVDELDRTVTEIERRLR